MPSIFNHENACWGVKRSTCDVFQFDIRDELQTRKPNEFGVASSPNILTPSHNSVQYSVSSNGYYGYQPHSIIQTQTNADSAMDVEETDIVPFSSIPNGNLSLSGNFTITSSSNCRENIRRKRPMNDSVVEQTKRSRQEGILGAEMTNAIEEESGREFHRKEYFSHPKCLMGHYM
uniref:Uncharacterized protein n=1 Tax=Homalodisca liturata TaxID=320908 RepID=A0A1B6JF71_9HEMI